MKWRRRVVAAMKTMDKQHWHRKDKRRNTHNDRGFALRAMENLSDDLFKKMFRLDRASFNYLVELIDIDVQRDCVKAQCSSGSSISTATRLAVTLRWLAGGSHHDLCFAWGLSHSVFYSERGVLWPTIQALDNCMKITFPIDDNDALTR